MLSRDDGSKQWRVEEAVGVVGRPAVTSDTVLFRTVEGLRCLDPRNGSERWRHTSGDVGSLVVPADDWLYTARGGKLTAFRSVRT